MKLFRILNGVDADKTFEVREKAVYVGRGQEQDIILADDRASRRHLVLEPRGEGVFVRDLGSSNGTFVNGQLVAEVELREGDVLLVGHTEIRYGERKPAVARPARVPRVRIESEPALGPVRSGRFGEPTNVLSPEQAAGVDQRTIIRAAGPAEAEALGKTVLEPARVGGEDLGGPTPSMAAEKAGEAAAQRPGPKVPGLLDTTLEGLGAVARALAGSAARLAAAKGITLGVQEGPGVGAAPLEARRVYVALVEALELALVLVAEGRACVLRAECEPENRAVLRLVVAEGLRPSERAAARLIEGRFGAARAVAEAHGGRFDVAPDDERDAAWRFRIPRATPSDRTVAE